MSAAGNQQMGPVASPAREAGPFKKPTAGWGKALTRMNLSACSEARMWLYPSLAYRFVADISEHLSEATP